MGEAKRRRLAGETTPKGDKPAPANVVQTEVFHRTAETGEAISRMLAAVNEYREGKAMKPLTRSQFIGYVLIPDGLGNVLAWLGQEAQKSRLVVTPEEAAQQAQAESSLGSYRGRRTRI